MFIIPLYELLSIVLRQAHARTFNLIEKIKEFKGISEEGGTDKEIKEVLSQAEIEDFEHG